MTSGLLKHRFGPNIDAIFTLAFYIYIFYVTLMQVF